MMNKKDKGFTLIELLATIIILGLLVTVAYFSVRAILDRGNNSYYKSQENMLTLAGQEYFADYREKLPEEIGDTESVTLKTLIDESYIDPIKDRDETDCDVMGSIVYVQKITDRDYQYFTELICNEYQTSEDEANPVIKFTPNKESSTDPITVKMNITDNEGVASYRYVIEKDGENYEDTGYLNYSGEITITLTEKGLYRITGYAIDINGNRVSRKSGKYSIYKGIDCAEVEFSSNVKSETWTNKNVNLTIKLPDNTYRWELSERVNGGNYEPINNYLGGANEKLTIDSDGKHRYRLVVYDNDGNSCIATTDEYYIDKTNPTCESTGGSDEWKNTTVTLVGICSDEGGSGCVENVEKDFSSNTNLTNQSPGTVYDKAGNSTVCPADQTVKVDRTAPSCESSGGSSKWTNEDITLKGTCSDEGGSGCTGDATKDFTSNTNKTNQSPGIVSDNAGNVRTCPANQTVKIDKNPPTCTSSGGSSSWSNTTITLIGRCSDTGGSGCTGNVSKNFAEDVDLTDQSPGTVYDNAGNSAVCPANQTVKVDKTAPSCESSGGSNNWTNQNITLIGTCNDNGGSGCTGNATNTFDSNTNKTNQSPGIVRDNAGNIRTCPADQTVKIDKTAPTCTSSGGSSNWTNQNVTITGICSDTGGSGCRGNTTNTFDSNINTTTASPGTVYDNAGNSRVCPANRTVKIDKTDPTCESSGGSNSWTNGSVTLIGRCSDTGGSGCRGNVTNVIDSNTNTTTASPGTVYDNAGNSAVCPANQTVRVDRTAPTCTNSGGSSSWTNQNVTITGTCSDTGGSGCSSNASKTYYNNTNTTYASPGTVYDNAGNSRICPADRTIKIDKTDPICVNSSNSPIIGSSQVTFEGRCTDSGGSNCTSSTVSKSFNIPSSGRVSGSPGTVYDNAGNSDVCPTQSVEVDTEPPSCPSISSTVGTRTWTNKNITLSFDFTNDTESWRFYSGKEGGTIFNRGEYDTSTTTATISSTGETAIFIRVFDEAGNYRDCFEGSVYYIDKTAPLCVSNGGSDEWTNQNVTITGTCGDLGGSGCVSDTSKTYRSNTNTTAASPGTVYDKAGNSRICPADQTVKIDKTDPVCTTSSDSPIISGNKVTFKGKCRDTGGSGCTSSTVSKVFNSSSGTVSGSPGTVYDEAGNSDVCPTQSVQLDSEAPSCPTISASVDQKRWTNKDVTLTFGFTSDTSKWEWYTGSSASSLTNRGSYNTSTKTASTTGTGKIYIKVRVYDDAGNYRDCFSDQVYYIDKTAPTCVSSGGSSSWKNTNITLKGTCSDTGGSGCAKVSDRDNRTYDDNGNVYWKISQEGSWTNRSAGTVYDAAGNSANCPANQTVKIDKTKPRLAYAYDVASDTSKNINGAVSSSNVSVSLSAAGNVVRRFQASDATSGVKEVQYNTTGSWHKESNVASYTLTKSQDAKYRVIDNAGNYSYVLSASIKIQQTQKLYLCRRGKTNIHWRQTTSCADTSANEYNCAVQLTYPKQVEVYAELQNGFYVMVEPISKYGHTFKYIHKGCLSTSSSAADCKSACPNN